MGMTCAEERAEVKRGHPVTVLLVLAILAAGAWFGCFYLWSYRAERHAWTVHRHYDACLRVCRLELALRAAAVRNYAAKTGRLPESLADCGADAPGVAEWMVWAWPRENDIVSKDWGLGEILDFECPLDESWAPDKFEMIEYPAKSNPRPPPGLDLFGLPITYAPGRRIDSDPRWLNSSDPLPAEVEKFLAARGGVPPPAQQPFALSSLFVRDRLDYIRNEDRTARVVSWTFLGGQAILIAVIILLLIRWLRTERGMSGLTALGVAGLFAGVAVFLGWGSTQATCYLVSRFRSSQLSPEQRLELLEKVVSRGEVSDKVAQLAREHIARMKAATRKTN